MRTTRKLLFNSSIVFVGTFLGGIFSYLFNMLMGRKLGPVNYGEMTALMSLLMIATVAGGAIVTVAMRYSSELYAGKHYQALQKFFKFLTKYVFILSGSIFVIGLVFLKPIASFLSIREYPPIIITLACVVFGLLAIVNRGFLQGTQKFVASSFSGVVEMALRLTIALALLALGFQLSGALAGIFLASALAYVITLFPLRKIFRLGKGKNEKFIGFDKKEIFNYSWPTLIAAALLVVSINTDIILVKHYFSPSDAGLYAAISTIGKIILYITGPIIAVMFPMVSEQRTKGEKHYTVFLFSVLMTLIGSLAILGVYVLMPGKVIGILYGNKYTEYYYLLPPMGLAILFYSLINIIVNYYLAIKNFLFLWFFGFVLALQAIAIIFWHPSLISVIQVLIFGFGLLFVLMFGYYLVLKKEAILDFLKTNLVKSSNDESA